MPTFKKTTPEAEASAPEPTEDAPDVERRLDYSDGGTGGWAHLQERAGNQS